ncbi:excinuclease ABC subunit UvrA [Aquincola tertiaricarbonis]|uniref:UvrABC system protein A n=1 Tax=Aquincola tertiaricarbonis TaxID=391953 RepID=A0ABY4S9D3_AQUTE|nr:excinuclease ABC subunit UvrA [Aquincola tertiaricarbonis]URI08502.1 excinuclease ABC subunit UvrA [Aquincola tertiaricarbonis]
MTAAAPTRISNTATVRVRGAREHNLKDVDVDIPRDALVVFTGVSGSGKSSLAFGTLYAEAQRRYFESVSPYARRLIDQVGMPDVDSIEGLPPAVSLQQQRGTPSARSSVGSVTTLSSSLRLMYSRAGSYPPGQPMLYAEDFSPNTLQGACPECHGVGRVFEVSERTMVPDDSLTIRERAVAAWPTAWQGQNLRDILVTLGHDVDVPWRDLPRKTRDWILFTEEQPTVPVYAGLTPAQTREALRRKLEPSYQGTFTGARRHVLHTFSHSNSAQMKRRAARFMLASPCPLCHGKRLKPEALSVTFAGLDIGALQQMPLDDVARILAPAARGEFDEAGGQTLDRAAARADTARRVAAGGSAHAVASDARRTPNLSAEKRLAAQRICTELLARIHTLQQLGLGYLSLDRSTPGLSAGELQRLRLATQIRSNLFGVVYVLDEPSAGLHPADNEALMSSLEQLRQSGNSIFVVEHDLGMMRRADWLVDVGPDAGERGGRVLYSGPPEGLQQVAASHTARYLFAEEAVAHRLPRPPTDWLVLQGVTLNNLRGVDARFPLGVLTAVTGVSGSGKSSLVTQALVGLVQAHLGGEPPPSPSDDETDPLQAEVVARADGRIDATSLDRIRRLVQVDQKPIGRTPRSNLATYTGLFDHVRKLFAATPAARQRHYDAGRFSFNVAKGRCSTCEGEGFVSVELLFMPSVYAPCPTCHGQRFNEATLQVKLRGRSIADVLAMTVEEALAFFEQDAAVARPLALLRDIGLGYLRLGQPATELSGGEAQRIKLATELQRAQRGDALYVLDEPTTGLHPADVDRLMTQLQQLVEAGNTVVLVEHDLRVVADCDWVIDLGPGGGDQGGRIVAAGTPAEVAQADGSRTGPYLRRLLKMPTTPSA